MSHGSLEIKVESWKVEKSQITVTVIAGHRSVLVTIISRGDSLLFYGIKSTPLVSS